MKKTVLLLSAVLMLSACADTPEDVKSRTEQRESVLSAAQSSEEGTKSPESSSAPELAKLPVSELAADAEQAISKKYSNFVFREGLKAEIPETLPVCDFEQVRYDLANAEKYAKRFFTEEQLSKETLEESSWTTLSSKFQGAYPELVFRSMAFHDEDAGLHFCYNDNGFLCMMAPIGMDRTMNHTAAGVEAMIRPEQGDDLSYKCVLGEDTEPTTAAEAVETAEKWLSEVYADNEPFYDFRISSVAAVLDDLGQYYYSITAEKYYKGIKLNNFGIRNGEDVAEESTGYTYHCDMDTQWELCLLMYSKGNIDYFTNGSGVIEPIEKGTLEEAVSLSAALEHMQQTFTDFNQPFEISEIKLRYMITPDSYDPIVISMPRYSGMKSTGRIVWEFTSDVPAEQLVGLGSAVDAETGELWFNFDLNNGLL